MKNNSKNAVGIRAKEWSWSKVVAHSGYAPRWPWYDSNKNSL